MTWRLPPTSKKSSRCSSAAVVLAALLFVPSIGDAAAQSRTSDANTVELPVAPPVTAPQVADVQNARTSDTGIGQVGQRQTRQDAAREAGIEPMARIDNRIRNRVQSRLRTRLDQNYSGSTRSAPR